MELSALGIPLEPLRYIWLIAFLLYLVVCVAVDIAYSSTMSKEEARRLHVFYKGSPVDKAMRYAERRSLDGDPLPKHKLRSNLTRARKELDSISGVSKFEAGMHAVMYVWACVIARSIFLLYKDIARDGILLPALVLPFYMVYLGACWSRFIWRSSRYFNLDNHTAGMPQVLGEMLNRIDAFFAPQDAHPQAKPVRSTSRIYLGLCGGGAGAGNHRLPLLPGRLDDFVHPANAYWWCLNHAGGYSLSGAGVALALFEGLSAVQPRFVLRRAALPTREEVPLPRH